MMLNGSKNVKYGKFNLLKKTIYRFNQNQYVIWLT